MAASLAGLFQWLNSDTCLSFYGDLTTENRIDVADRLMDTPEFVEAAREFGVDTHIIRQKLETKLGQLCKKMSVRPLVNAASVPSIPSVPCPTEETTTLPEQCVVGIDIDPEKGTHIGSGFYLKREGHLIKMTSPDWVVYY
jgi:hypothetical protein